MKCNMWYYWTSSLFNNIDLIPAKTYRCVDNIPVNVSHHHSLSVQLYRSTCDVPYTSPIRHNSFPLVDTLYFLSVSSSIHWFFLFYLLSLPITSIPVGHPVYKSFEIANFLDMYNGGRRVCSGDSYNL